MRIRWTRVGLGDLASARDHLLAENPAAAEALLLRVADALAKLNQHPRMGRIVPERRSLGYREVMVAPYRLVYLVSKGELQILRFW
ncbi:MAG TPA: type II toxin-antitoxin system RelE/ParE family toxin, partial [Myxococcales bacterium]|nr:type II toxin-antitoxin system RelE/ParE family toxin [Myxococcales bacterium]